MDSLQIHSHITTFHALSVPNDRLLMKPTKANKMLIKAKKIKMCDNSTGGQEQKNNNN